MWWYEIFFGTIALICRSLALDEYETNTPDSAANSNAFRIEGKLVIPRELTQFIPQYWNTGVRILLNYGEHQAFLKDDYTFVVDNVPTGSYVVEVANKELIFEPVRVDVSGRGKARARKLNLAQPALVINAPYPVKLLAKAPARYFRQREVWRVTDFMFNPMVLMMVIPFAMLMIFPKLINTSDPEFQREVQQIQMPKYELPDMSEYLANWYGGKKGAKSTKCLKARK